MATRNVWRLSSLPKGVQPNIKDGAVIAAHDVFFSFFFEMTICKLKKLISFVKLLWTSD